MNFPDIVMLSIPLFVGLTIAEIAWIRLKGMVALDVGASTGGFTQVLLEAGTLKVYALDVGHGQLHPKLASDPRVVNLEGVVPMVDFIVTDLLFISLTKALPMALGLGKQGTKFVGLIKPKFEVGRAGIGKNAS